jgi:hypothetical protein
VIVGTPYHKVCPASFLMPLKGLEFVLPDLTGLTKVGFDNTKSESTHPTIENVTLL